MKTIQKTLGDKHVERVCPICEKRYIARKRALETGHETTCSRRCSYAFRAQKQQAGVTVICAVCRREVPRSPSHVKSKHGADFCSRRCHYVGRVAGLTKRVVRKPYQYTEGGLTRLRKAAARLYASGKALAYPKTELAVVDALTHIRVRFIHQHLIELPDRAYVVDFFFPDRNLVIELDTRDQHGDRADADAKRDANIRRLGLQVVRLWDNKRPDNAVRAVLATLFDGSEN